MLPTADGADLARACARLRDAEPLELPTDRPRLPQLAAARARHAVQLAPALSSALQALSECSGVRTDLTLLAAYQVLLARYSGMSDFVLAVREDVLPSLPRTLLGSSPSLLMVRSAFAAELTFEELLQRTAAGCATARQELSVSLAQLVAALELPRDESRAALAQVAFAWSDGVAPADAGHVHAPELGAPFDLTLSLATRAGCIAGSFEYARALFDGETIARMERNFCTLLHAIVCDNKRSVSRLPLVHGAELELLARVNDTDRPLPSVGGFHELIRAQISRTPERTAVVDADGSETYAELGARSDGWAARLAALGVTRGSRVGVALGRTRRALEVMLGVLKTGAAYVPLDVSFPRDRLRFMIEDAGLAVVVTEQAACEALPEGGAYRVLLAEQVEQDAPPALAPLVLNEPDDLAYIIYTSGSTGRPKGVEVRHEGVLNFLLSSAREPGVSADDRVLAVSTFSFDISILDLFLPLTLGACTMLAPRMCASDGATLARYIDEFAATFVQATPTTFSLLVQAGLPLRPFKALAGGEAFPAQLARDLAPRCEEIWNAYGPTEATVYASYYRVVDPEQPMLIGLPIANTRMYVLDGAQQPVPFGVAGELYIGGLGVSRGYRNRSDLTEERFLPDPFSTAKGARMYRTGDIVRMRPRGVQYVGRIDHQVKLRGYRIELGEIESVLATHPAVEACAVVVRELASDDLRLVAYFTKSSGASVSADALGLYLEQRLPSYMVPRFIVALDELPMTPSGKVDRKQLPDPRGHEVASAGVRTAPQNATERALLEVWQNVLGVQSLGVDDDFFLSGGHSLLAVQLVQQLNRALRTSLSLGLVFEAPTIRAQAERIDFGAHGGGVSAIPLKRDGDGDPLFCICGINLYQSLAAHLTVGRPVYGLFLPVEGELFENGALELDTREMARQYVELLRSVQPHGPYHLTGVSFGGVLAYEMARQLRDAGEEVALLALLDVVLPETRAISRGQRRRDQVARLAGRVPSLVRRLADRAKRSLDRGASGERASAPPRDGEIDWGALHAHREERYARAMSSYAVDMPPYDGDVLLVRAREQVKSMPGCAVDYGWSRHARGSLTCIDVSGDHLGILSEPHVHELAAILSDYL